MEILTGNELVSGATVYLDVHNRWVEDLQAALDQFAQIAADLSRDQRGSNG